jgi:hypothetical protein
MRYLISILFLLLPAFAQTDKVAGDWLMKMQAPQGEVEMKFTLKADGDKLTGTFENARLVVEKASFADNALKMTVNRDKGAMVYEMKATLDGDTLKGTAETDMGGTPAMVEWSATKSK